MKISMGWVFLFILGCRHFLQLAMTREQKPGRGREWLSTGYLAASYLTAAYFAYMSLRGLAYPTIRQLIALGLVLSALLLRFAALYQLGDNFSYQLRIARDHRLVTHGIYSRIRHPLHLAFFTEVLGMALISFELIPLIAAGVLIFVIIHRNREEDLALETRFGEQFRQYKNSTSSMVPFAVFPGAKPVQKGKDASRRIPWQRR